MIKFRLFAWLLSAVGSLLAFSAQTSLCQAQVTFIGDTVENPSTDFNLGTNWDPGGVPVPGGPYLIQNGRTATFSSGTTSVGELTVGKENYGRLLMTGGSLEVTDSDFPLEIGLERHPDQPVGADYNGNGVVDAADYSVWLGTLGSSTDLRADGNGNGTIDQDDYVSWKAGYGNRVKGGEVIMSGNSTITTNGLVSGRRTIGLLSIGPMAQVHVQGDNTSTGDVRTANMEIGSYGPAYITSIFGEEGLDGNGLVVVEGTLNANELTINSFGSRGEFRLLPGGTVKLNGALVMSHCDTQFFSSGCGLISTDPSELEPLMSSKVSIIGSGGSFEVGLFEEGVSPPPREPDSELRRDIRSEFPSTATISFTADAGGVTPIVLADNSSIPDELTGNAYLDGTVGNVPGTYAGINLVLNLDEYTGSAPLTLIDAPDGHLFGVFGSVSFLGTRTATVEYDYVAGDVFLTNFQNGMGLASGTAVPEPHSAILFLIFSLSYCFHSVRRGRERRGSYELV